MCLSRERVPVAAGVYLVSRYLTAQEKARELAAWQDTLASRMAGAGAPDPEIIFWCEKINVIRGACTLQSCAGHETGERGPLGHLWLRFNEEKARAFHERAFELAQRKYVDRVSLIYQPWGAEVVQIEFRGLPDGQLGSSMVELLTFLRSLDGSAPTPTREEE